MPTIPYDDSVITPRLQAAPQRQKTGIAESIARQSSEQLAGSISGLVQTGANIYQKHHQAQDEADMVAARAAYLRMQKEESFALQTAANTKEIEDINTSYKKKYDAIMSGNDPAFDRPYFRNESGKNSFKTQFSDGFNLKRDLSASDQAFQLDRRNTHAGFINGIKSIPESNYYDKPMAEAETVEYVDKLVEHGFLTEQEGVEKKDIHLRNLDIERAGRKLNDITAEPKMDLDGSGAHNPVFQQVDQYKEYVNGLSNLNEDQKKNFSKKADSILYNADKATKAAEKERQVLIDQQQNEYQTQAMIDVAEGKRTLSSIFHDKDISQKYKEKNLPRYIKKNDEYKKIIADEKKSFTASKKAFEVKLWNDAVNSGLKNKVHVYDESRHDNASGSVKAALMSEIYGAAGMTGPEKTYLAGILKDSDKLPAHIKERKQNHLDDMERILGLTKESFTTFSEIDVVTEKGILFDSKQKKAFIDEVTGSRMVDGLSEYQRREVINSGFMQYDSLMKQGKEKEAEEYMNDYKSKYEKSQNDTLLYDNYFKKVRQ